MTKETSICKIHKENEIVHLQFYDSINITYSDLCEIYEYINEVYGAIKYTQLIDIRSNINIDKKAKKFIKKENAKGKILAQAILAGKNTNEEIFTAFVGMDAEKTPIRVFTDYDSAVNWLNSAS